MKRPQGRAALVAAAAVLISGGAALSQTPVPVRRALPVEQPPVARALPVETATPAPEPPTIMRALPVPPSPRRLRRGTRRPGGQSAGRERRVARATPAQLRQRAFRSQTLRSRRSGIRKISRPLPEFVRLRHRPFLHGAGVSRAQPLRRRAHQFPRAFCGIFRRPSWQDRPPTASRRFVLTRRISPRPFRFSPRRGEGESFRARSLRALF